MAASVDEAIVESLQKELHVLESRMVSTPEARTELEQRANMVRDRLNKFESQDEVSAPPPPRSTAPASDALSPRTRRLKKQLSITTTSTSRVSDARSDITTPLARAIKSKNVDGFEEDYVYERSVAQAEAEAVDALGGANPFIGQSSVRSNVSGFSMRSIGSADVKDSPTSGTHKRNSHTSGTYSSATFASRSASRSGSRTSHDLRGSRVGAAGLGILEPLVEPGRGHSCSIESGEASPVSIKSEFMSEAAAAARRKTISNKWFWDLTAPMPSRAKTAPYVKFIARATARVAVISAFRAHVVKRKLRPEAAPARATRTSYMKPAPHPPRLPERTSGASGSVVSWGGSMALRPGPKTPRPSDLASGGSVHAGTGVSLGGSSRALGGGGGGGGGGAGPAASMPQQVRGDYGTQKEAISTGTPVDTTRTVSPDPHAANPASADAIKEHTPRSSGRSSTGRSPLMSHDERADATRSATGPAKSQPIVAKEKSSCCIIS